VQELQAEAFQRASAHEDPRPRLCAHGAPHPLRFMMADGKTPKVSFGSALTKTIYIARRLRNQIGEQQMVGMLLPPIVGGALTNYALMLLGRVPSI
jgi:hypothetical protein